MGMEIMRPQGCLIKRAIVSPAVIHHHHHRKRGGCYGNGYMNPRFCNKKSPEKEGRFDNGTVKNYNNNCKSNSSSNLVIGRVRILKRGESPQMQMQAGDIDRKARRISADDVITSRINRLGSESDTATAAAVEIKFMADMYAGSAFSMSPSPRSLPLPSFFNIKTQAHSQTVDDSATIGLRRLLRLE